MGLKQKTVSGFIWTTAGTIGNGIAGFLVTMVLARKLLPYDFALIALLNIFLAVSRVIVNSGFSQAIIRDESPSEKDLSSVFYFNIVISFIIYVVLFISAPLISSYFNAPELTLLSRVVFLVIIINSFSIIQNATLNRSLNFAAVNKSAVIGTFLAGVISIVMAFTGFGIWSLVANMVLLPFFRSILLWYHSKWRPIKRLSFLSIKKYFAFGSFLMIQGVVDAVSTNLASILIGKVYSKNELGYFSQGNKFDSYLVRPFNTIVNKVTYPILSKIKNENARLKYGYRKIVGVVMFAFIPVMLFTISASENMIVSFFGDKWIEAGIYLKIAAIGSLFLPLQFICTNVIMIKGKTRIMLRFAFIKHGIRIVLLVLFVNSGVLALAIVFSISTILGSLLYIVLGMTYLKYSFMELLKDLYKTFLSSLIGISTVLLIQNLAFNINIIGVFLIQALAMMLFYTISSKVLKNEYYKETLSLIKSFL